MRPSGGIAGRPPARHAAPARWLARWLALSLLVAAQPAYAAANCAASASAVSFGTYSPFSASPRDAVGNVRVSCSLLGLVSLTVSYTVRLSAGGSGGYATRRMTGTAGSLDYNLYTTSARTTVWGNGAAGSATLSDGYLLGLLTVNRDYPVYGRIPALQNVSAGTYTDTITVTVDY